MVISKYEQSYYLLTVFKVSIVLYRSLQDILVLSQLWYSYLFKIINFTPTAHERSK